MSSIFDDFALSEKLTCFHSDCQSDDDGFDIFMHLVKCDVFASSQYPTVFFTHKMVLSSELICDSAQCAKCWL